MIFNGTYGKGGNGGLLPRIRISAPTGSTITVNGRTVTEQSGTWIYNCPSFGTYSVVATLSGSTKTQNVTVDACQVYSITITY